MNQHGGQVSIRAGGEIVFANSLGDDEGREQEKGSPFRPFVLSQTTWKESQTLDPNDDL